MNEKTSRFWKIVEGFLRIRSHLTYKAKERDSYLSENIKFREKIRLLEREFLRRYKASELLGIVFDKDVCPHYSTGVVLAASPKVPRGTCMKYGSYGHIELGLPWGMPLCTLVDADTCPIFNHATVYTYGIDDGEKPYMSTWWPNIKGEEERVTDWYSEVYMVIWDWLKEHKEIAWQYNPLDEKGDLKE